MKRLFTIAGVMAALFLGMISAHAAGAFVGVSPGSLNGGLVVSANSGAVPNMKDASYRATLGEDGLVVSGTFKVAVSPDVTSVAASLFDDGIVMDDLECSVTSATAFSCRIDIADVTLANGVADLSAKIEFIKGLGITFGSFVVGQMSNSSTCTSTTVEALLKSTTFIAFDPHVPIRPINPILIADFDADDDGITDKDDNCVDAANADQKDWNEDGVGDACSDTDGDSVMDAGDNCVEDSNANQADEDEDGIGDVCDDDFVNPDTIAPLSAGEGCSLNPAATGNAGFLWVLAGVALLAIRRKR